MRQLPHKATKRRSQRQEVALANDLAGLVQPGSGSLPHAKGDVRVRGKYRAECKFTRAKSYTLKIETLNKIRSECASDETPVLDLAFLDTNGRTTEHWVAIPYSVWLELQNKRNDVIS